MAEEKKPSDKTIEMRLAEIEDKLAQMHVTEDEMRAYKKVSALVGGVGQAQAGQAQGAPAPALSPIVCTCIVTRAVQRWINRGINDCIPGCAPGPGFDVGGGGGTFGGFGS